MTTVPVRFTAELLRGNVYYLATIRLDRGAQVVIEDYHREHLVEHGSDRVADEDGEIAIKKRFKFRPYEGFEPVGTVVVAPPAHLRTEDSDDVDLDRQARLRQFHDREKQRMAGPAAAAPKFDPGSDLLEEDEVLSESQPLAVVRPRVTEVVNDLTVREEVEEVTSAPRPRARPRS